MVLLYITFPEFTHDTIESVYPLTNMYMDYLILSLQQLYVIGVIDEENENKERFKILPEFTQLVYKEASQATSGIQALTQHSGYK